ncbi:MAG: O-linked N-acetylglucosamine transferase, SPINDLY family protein [Hormoscilla sp. GM7CHS1pb]|nr:O-linked N-acetylglucosamine transferase, SPINDLY family protein [Hormoscilla sp. GM7CHS1pb]
MSVATIMALEQPPFIELIIKGEYSKACKLYQQAIEAAPEVRSNYWYLGLALLLEGKEVEAQITWMLAIGEAEGEEIDCWTGELVEVLQTEAERRESLLDYEVAWAIRQHVREIIPNDINNILRLVQLSLKQKILTEEQLTEWGVIERLKSDAKAEVKYDLLLEVLQVFLEEAPLDPLLIEFVEACLPQIREPLPFIGILIEGCARISENLNRPDLAIILGKLCLRIAPEHADIWMHISTYHQNVGQYDRGIEMAKKGYSLTQTLPGKLYAKYVLIRGLMSAGGRWLEAVDVWTRQLSLVISMCEEKTYLADLAICFRTYTSTYFFPYFRDDPRNNRQLHNQVAQLCQTYVELHEQERVDRYRQRYLSSLITGTTKPLRIGYLSHCLRSHSVGWLARWLFEHHDREKYDIYGYFINYGAKIEDPLQEWFVQHVSYARKLGLTCEEAAEKVYEDEIDILVDLNSLTLDISCGVMAMKPAPVQVTWLGWDAAGIPTVDYTIADPYVLPEDAQDYYSETIWRLPKTYIAVDGFEVAVPTLRREQLEVESDAVLYLSSQRGYKRHPDTARLQLRIIKEVPNSYFLIKGSGDRDTIKSFFIQLAEEEGVSPDRLRFLSIAPSEATHRANLGIADVVLDTYPYNGATTTLETLWMCVPLVTRVGEQFAARNSYTMMMNAGITEGIAWTDEEYVEWGVRLGEDPALRQQISWRLRQSRQTAPLWNAKQFAREMENAYEQMWQRYVESGNGNR